jgi:hypothetical protein
MSEKWYFRSREEGLYRKLLDGVTTNIFSGQHVMLSIAEIAPNTTSVIHSHPEEQWGYLIQGDCIRIQGVRTGEKTAIIMDIFGPPRSAYTKPGEGMAATEYPQEPK